MESNLNMTVTSIVSRKFEALRAEEYRLIDSEEGNALRKKESNILKTT